jgi:hypothetical protein
MTEVRSAVQGCGLRFLESVLRGTRGRRVWAGDQRRSSRGGAERRQVRIDIEWYGQGCEIAVGSYGLEVLHRVYRATRRVLRSSQPLF